MRPDFERFDLDGALARIPRQRRPSFLVRTWYRRHAFLYLVVVPGGLVELGIATHPALPAGAVVAAALVYVTSAELRRWVHVRARCVQAERMVRGALWRARICGPDGRPPVVWWVAPTPAGVYVHVVYPSRMRPELILRARDAIQEATGAAVVDVFREAGRRIVVIELTYPRRERWWEG